MTSRRKSKQARQKSNRLLYIIATMMVMVVVMIALKPPPSSIIFETTDKSFLEVPIELGPPTAEQQRFMNEEFLTTLYRLRVEYPIESVRAEFNRVMTKAQQDTSGRAEIAFNVVRNRLDQKALFISYQENGQLTIGIVLKNVQRQFRELSDQPEALEDMLVSAILHENFHLEHHNVKPSANSTYQEMARRESEAWIYSVEQVLLPMRLAGRMNTKTGTDAGALAAYQAAGGDPNHPTWQRFARWACGYED